MKENMNQFIKNFMLLLKLLPNIPDEIVPEEKMKHLIKKFF